MDQLFDLRQSIVTWAELAFRPADDATPSFALSAPAVFVQRAPNEVVNVAYAIDELERRRPFSAPVCAECARTERDRAERDRPAAIRPAARRAAPDHLLVRTKLSLNDVL